MLSSRSSTNGFESDLGARVRTLRRERGLTLKGLGRLAGLSHPFLSPGRARPRPPERRLGRADRRRAGRVGRAASGRRRAAATRSSSCAATRATFDETTGVRELGGEPGDARSCASGRPAPAAGPRRPTSSTARSRSTSPAARSRSTSTATIHALDEGDTLRFDGSIPHRLRRTGGTSTRALHRHHLKGPGPFRFGTRARRAARRPRAASRRRVRSAAIATPERAGAVAHAGDRRCGRARRAAGCPRRRAR